MKPVFDVTYEVKIEVSYAVMTQQSAVTSGHWNKRLEQSCSKLYPKPVLWKDTEEKDGILTLKEANHLRVSHQDSKGQTK